MTTIIFKTNDVNVVNDLLFIYFFFEIRIRINYTIYLIVKMVYIPTMYKSYIYMTVYTIIKKTT